MRFALNSNANLAALLAALALGGCAVGPAYHRPPVDAPAGFRGAPPSPSTNSLADLPWWRVFEDPALQDLIETALTNNYDLRIALARVEQARSIEIQGRSGFFPQVGYGATATEGRNMFLNLPNPNGGKVLDSFAGGLGAAWEVDLWGRVRRMNEAARAAFLASEEARRGVRLSLISGVAKAYFELIELDDQLAIARRTAQSFDHTFKLFKDQHDSGLASRLELSRAKAALCSVSATIPDLERQTALKENEISVLLGRRPAPIPRSGGGSTRTFALEVPAGLPSTLLERRPDIRMAEQQLHAANARIGVAIGDFFPRIGLTAVYGGVSSELSDLTGPGAGAWSLAATTTGPIFQGGRLSGRYREAKAACEQARLRYQETILEAFREVSDALISRQKVEEMSLQQSAAVEAFRDAADTATERYSAGKANYFEVLEAQQQLFPAETTLSRTETARRLAIIQLYKSLGGGWNLKDDQWNHAATPRRAESGSRVP